nr:hypothetical protein [Tanacetum cinerariifolium]
MADVNAPSGQTPAMAPPLHADDQILLHIREKEGHSDCDSKHSVHQADYPSLHSTCLMRSLFLDTSSSVQRVAQHRRYLAGETGGVQDPPAPKPTQPARKPKTTVPKAPSRPSVSIPVVDEDVEYQKVLEETMKDAYALPRGTLPPVVIREPKSGKYQLLPEVPGKGKAKVTEEQSDSEEESEKVVLRAEEVGQDEGQAGPDPGAQAEDQTRSNAGAQAEDQTGSDAGHARPDPGDAEAKVQSILSPMVYAGSNREHIDLDVADVSPQPSTDDKPSEADKNAETKVESMVNVPIQQALSSISLQTSPIVDLSSRPESPKAHQQGMMVKCIGELEQIMADLIQVNKDIEERLDSHGSRLYTLELLDIPQQVSIAVSEVVTDAVDWAMQAPLRNHFRDLPEADMKEILYQRMWESESYKSHEDHMQLFEALEKSMNRDHSEELAHLLLLHQWVLLELQGLLELLDQPKCHHHHLHCHPPTKKVYPKGSAAPSPSKTAASAKYQAWTTTNIRLRPSISLTPTDLEMHEDMAHVEQAQSSDDEDIGSAHIPTVNLRQGWWKPFEEKRSETPEPAWSIRSSDVPVLTNNWASALASNYSPPHEDSLLAQTGDIATFMDWFCKRPGITELKPQDLEGP